ncbi:dTDP-4-dehydrorhamnose 3,5-epimerase family protein [cyanobacterium endosymbiont of Rhopalodia gibberula]|uniref:dTDP-4-dehydrorhamnose 3,5-epimerase family protein n=1 Tax=cyanobacterium endosymbiont of Rhopalodia gibberula TaxID=1763363 RepID=UPI001558637E|nr:dTDP-4-dehydrorhamnose 3,5-epimerase family protein [cyanobacterium endosymbiont of Rhopalodia gibberula]
MRTVIREVLGVAIDIRKSFPPFGQWVGYILSVENKRIFWILKGFTHRFIFLSDKVEFLYKAADYHIPQHKIIIL